MAQVVYRMILFHDLPQFLIQLLCPAAGIFDIDKGAVQDAHPVGIDGKQQLMLLGVIVAAEGHGLGGVVVGVGRIGLVELLPEGDLRQQFAELPVLGIVHGEQVVLQVVPAGKAGDFFGADGHLGAGRKAGRKVDLAGRQDEHQKQHHQHHKAEPV